MNTLAPRYLLFSEARRNDFRSNGGQQLAEAASHRQAGGQWRFVLEDLDGASVMDVADDEDTDEGDRLELLAVVRGLEALEQPSRVTLVTASQYVSRGIRLGLAQWRESQWRWERLGQWVPIKNGDLWKRVDRALQFHQVECRTWRFESAHASAKHPHSLATALGPRTSRPGGSVRRQVPLRVWLRWLSCWKTKAFNYLSESLFVRRMGVAAS